MRIILIHIGGDARTLRHSAPVPRLGDRALSRAAGVTGLVQRVNEADSRAAIVFFPLDLKEGKGTSVHVGPREVLGYDTLWLDPVSGRSSVELTPRRSCLRRDSSARLESPQYGTPYKVALFLLGLVVAGLSVTGVVIWWRKLQSRHAMHRRKLASTGSTELTRSSLTSLCLVAGVLLASALPGALHYFL